MGQGWQSRVSVTRRISGARYTGTSRVEAVIHMNGRIYSPSLGRMLSPDPVTQSPEDGQNYNRYTYAFNNPLKYTDPSGYVGVDLGRGDTLDSAEYGTQYWHYGSNGVSLTRGPTPREKG